MMPIAVLTTMATTKRASRQSPNTSTSVAIVPMMRLNSVTVLARTI